MLRVSYWNTSSFSKFLHFLDNLCGSIPDSEFLSDMVIQEQSKHLAIGWQLWSQ